MPLLPFISCKASGRWAALVLLRVQEDLRQPPLTSGATHMVVAAHVLFSTQRKSGHYAERLARLERASVLAIEPVEGVEPPTRNLQGCRSDRLSYTGLLPVYPAEWFTPRAV